MAPANNNSLRNDIYKNASARVMPSQTDLVQRLLYQIMRVKELIKLHETTFGGTGKFGASILNELVSEAYLSLVNYDTELMLKYYDLLLNCD